jgi:hypothetical protein
MTSPLINFYHEALIEMLWPRDTLPELQEHEDQVEVSCPECNGDSGWEVITGYSSRDGEPTGYWEECPCCEGRGGGWIDAEPRTLEDLDDCQ